jgi:DNA-binding transcriptional ArsR family regulator
LRNPTYRELADVSEAVAGRDLKALVVAGLLDAVGERRGRYYLATPDLRGLDRAIQQTRKPIEDPFETLGATVPLGSDRRDGPPG